MRISSVRWQSVRWQSVQWYCVGWQSAGVRASRPLRSNSMTPRAGVQLPRLRSVNLAIASRIWVLAQTSGRLCRRFVLQCIGRNCRSMRPSTTMFCSSQRFRAQSRFFVANLRVWRSECNPKNIRWIATCLCSEPMTGKVHLAASEGCENRGIAWPFFESGRKLGIRRCDGSSKTWAGKWWR